MNTPSKAARLDPDLISAILDPDLIGGFLDSAKKREDIRMVSKSLNQTFFDNLQCADAQELKAMRSEPEPCKNTAKVIYNPEKGLQRAIMCAIMSTNEAHSPRDLHVYLFQDHLEPFRASKSVKCFDQQYALALTLLCPPNVQQDPPNLHCRGGFRALEYHVAEEGQYPGDAQVVLFTGNTHVAERDESQHFRFNDNLIALLDMSTLRTIGKWAFSDCSLSEIVDDMPEVTDIHDAAFKRSHLTRLGDTPNLRMIHPWAFAHCSQLKQLGDVKALTEIKEYAFFMCEQLTQLDMPTVKTIGHSAFQSCALLEQLDMPQVKTIGHSAFRSCALLAQLGETLNLTEIGTEGFAGCRIERLNMPSLLEIGGYAFSGCNKLVHLENMPKLTEIGPAAFLRCTKLEKLCLPRTLTTVGKNAFGRCPLGEITVEPGAEFECHCDHLANKLDRLEGIHVYLLQTGGFRISAP